MGTPVPPWLVSDWVLTVASAGFVLVGWFLCSAMYGAVAAALVSLDIGAAGPGALTGLYLPFVGLGATTSVAATVGDSQVAVGGSYIPVLFLLLLLVLPWKTFDFARPRLSPVSGTQLAFVVKLSLVVGLAVGIVAGIISFNDGGGDDALVAEVSSSSAGLLAFFFLAVTGAVHAYRRHIILMPERLRVFLSSPHAVAIKDGATAFVMLALGGAALSLGGALVIADSTEARIAAVVTLPFSAGNMGSAFASVSSGASVSVFGTHLSLFHFGLPPLEDAKAVSPPVLAVLALGPGLVCWRVLEHLNKACPRDDRTIMSIGFLTGLGYALTMWLAALLLAIRATGSVLNVDEFDFDGTSVSLFAEPSVAATFGLALLLGVIGGIGGAFYWSQAHGVRWFAVSGQPRSDPSSGWPQQSAPPPPPQSRQDEG